MADSTNPLRARLGPWLVVYLKGVFMGAADTVPGVSGGTIALITGIYDRLIAAITALDPWILVEARQVHTRQGRAAIRGQLRRMDVAFLAVLGMGIASAVLLLSSVMHRAVTEWPGPTYAFFGGLIAASAVVLYRYVAVDTPGRILAAVVGFAVAFLVAGATAGPATSQPSLLVVGLAGAVAVTAMILPGVSGAFILVLLGLYEYMSAIPRAFVEAVLQAIDAGDLSPLSGPGIPLIAFLGGAVVGLLTVAHVVRWALDRYHEATLSFLIALMVGALRAPIRTILESGAGRWTPGFLSALIGTATVGVLLVLLLDSLTHDLEY